MHFISRFSAIIALFLAWLAASPSFAGDASTYQQDAAHDGYASIDPGFGPSFKTKWTQDLGGVISYPIIANHRIYVTVSHNSKAKLFALDLETGATIWERPIRSTYGWSNAAYANGRLFVVNFGCLMKEFAADDVGTPGWSIQLPVQYACTSPPVEYQGRVYTGGAGSGGTLYAVDASTGALEWAKGVQNGDSSSPAIGDRGVYVTYPCQYYKFGLVNGTLKWNTNRGCEGGGGNTPVYFNGNVYVRDWAKHPVVLNAETGKVLGSYSSNTPPAFWPNAGGSPIEYTLSSGTLTATDTTTGNVLWNFAVNGQLVSNPLVVNNYVVIGSGAGRVYILDAATGSRVWSHNVGSAISGDNEGGTLPTTGFAASGKTLVITATNQISAIR